MGVIGPHDSAGNMRIIWMDLVQTSPFSYNLLMQQGFKVAHVDFGTARDSKDVHISSRYFVKSTKRPQMSNFLTCVPAVDKPH